MYPSIKYGLVYTSDDGLREYGDTVNPIYYAQYTITPDQVVRGMHNGGAVFQLAGGMADIAVSGYSDSATITFDHFGTSGAAHTSDNSLQYYRIHDPVDSNRDGLILLHINGLVPQIGTQNLNDFSLYHAVAT